MWFLDNTSRQNLGEVLLSYGQFAQYAISYRFFDVRDNTKMRNDAILPMSKEETDVAHEQQAAQVKAADGLLSDIKLGKDSWFKILSGWSDEIAMDLGQLWNIIVSGDIKPSIHAPRVKKNFQAKAKPLDAFDREFLTGVITAHLLVSYHDSDLNWKFHIEDNLGPAADREFGMGADVLERRARVPSLQ